MAKEKFIEANKISFSYPAFDGSLPNLVLDGISVSVDDGEFLAVLGHNGSGKSTLAKHFNAILVPTEGKVTVDGINTAEESRLYEIRQEVGMVFQNPDNQFVGSTVADDIAFGLENRQVPTADMPRIIEEFAHEVGMEAFLDH